jgi:hypothetical protein
MGAVMDQRRLLGLVGVGLLVGGVYAPVLRYVVGGPLTYWNNPEGSGVAVLCFAGLALVCVGFRWYRWLLAVAMVTLALLAFDLTLYAVNSTVLGAKIVASSLVSIPSASLAWGWLPLFAGALVTGFAGALDTPLHAALKHQPHQRRAA